VKLTPPLGDLDQTVCGDLDVDGFAGQPPSHVIGKRGQADPTTPASEKSTGEHREPLWGAQTSQWRKSVEAHLG
jgi:hypothetical protein